ncbi:hypothetical protein E2C01_040950 [Portunus trituberculatus]|uniref:Uncharacterized protein n=1 Tax=Portunus trituberculatus TaxID=210409 RepID=A0A5B7FL45_PORTR|nr:hypothetical protein [Portunus trituberculatus]
MQTKFPTEKIGFDTANAAQLIKKIAKTKISEHLTSSLSAVMDMERSLRTRERTAMSLHSEPSLACFATIMASV